MRRASGKRRISILAAGAVAFGVFGVAPTTAHVRSFDSDISIGYGNGAFAGRVTSNRPRCRRNRIVNVIKIRRNRPDRAIGFDITNDAGRWRVPKSGARGRFYAVVGNSVSGGYGHKHRCKPGTSGTIRVRR